VQPDPVLTVVRVREEVSGWRASGFFVGLLAFAAIGGAVGATVDSPAKAGDLDAVLVRLTGIASRDRWVEVSPLAAGAPAHVFSVVEGERQSKLAGVVDGWAMVCAGGEGSAPRCEKRLLHHGDRLDLEAPVTGVRVVGRLALGRVPAAGARIAAVPDRLVSRRFFTIPLSRDKRTGTLVREVVSSAAGAYTLALLAPGNYRLEVRSPGGRIDHGEPFTVPAPAKLRRKDADPAEIPTLDLGLWSLDPGVAVEVTVTDSAGVPIPGAGVGAGQRDPRGETTFFETKSGPGGVARLTGIDPGRALDLTCVAPGFVRREESFAQVAPAARCVLLRQATLAGSVIDDSDRPVAGATVTLRHLQRSATTDAAGRFSFETLDPGPERLVAVAPGHRAAERRLVLAAAERRTLEPIRLTSTSGRDGRVVDGATGELLAGAEITVTDPPGGGIATTDDEGAFTIDVDADEPVQIDVREAGYAHKSFALKASSEGTPDVVRLSRGGRIRVSVWDEEADAPCAGCDVTLAGESGGAPRLTTDAEGEAVSEPLDPGLWSVALVHVQTWGSVVRVEGGAATQRVVVEPGVTTWVQLGKGASLLVTFSSPLPAGWALQARGPTSTRLARPHPDGSFSVRRRPREELRLSLVDPAMHEVPQVVLPPDFEEPSLGLPLHATGVAGVLVRDKQPAEIGELRLVPAAGGAGAASAATDGAGAFSVPYLVPGVYTLVADGKPVRTVAVEDGKTVDLGQVELPAS
jgi:protocatechuate 3,4-dioxygenase beta subunit